MNAEIIAVGSELLTPTRMDTNSLWLTDRLNALGIEVVAKTIIGDDRARLAETFTAALRRSEIILLTGGLGPTEDDVTRDAVAQALGRTQTFRQDLCDGIEARFQKANRKMAEINKRQAFVVDGFDPLPNPRGTAPGLWGSIEGGKAVALLPGPPNEMKGVFAEQVEPRIKQLMPPLHIATLQFRVAGMTESDLDQLIAPVYTKYTNPVTTVLAAPGDIQVHLRARCESQTEAEGLVAELGAAIEALLGRRIYSRSGETLEEIAGKRLKEKDATLSVAESCTGGLVAERITRVAGSSRYFVGGFLVYSNAIKTSLLGIDSQLIEAHTEVSEPVARAMAEAAKAKTGSTHALSITGYAGPEGGTETNPVGTVFIGLATPQSTEVRRLTLFGERARVRALASTNALDWLRRHLESV